MTQVRRDLKDNITPTLPVIGRDSPTISGWWRLHPAWSWTSVGMGHPQLLLGLKIQESVQTPKGTEQPRGRDENTLNGTISHALLPGHCPSLLLPHLCFAFPYQSYAANTAKETKATACPSQQSESSPPTLTQSSASLVLRRQGDGQSQHMAH